MWKPFALALPLLLLAGSAFSDTAKQVTIDNFTFSPATLTVAQGAEVTWTNRDDIPHSIVVSGLGVHSKALDSDASFTYRFDKAGSFDYMCGLHPHMHGKIIVQ